MRFELNFAAVVRNVAVMANVAILAVERFVAGYQPALHAMLGHTHSTGTLRHGTRSGWCDSCHSSADGSYPLPGLAFAVISPEREISKRWRQERLMSKRQIATAISMFGTRG
jgi:hypothetical protein